MNESLDLSLLNYCDVVIKYDGYALIGLHYNDECFDAPIVLFKRKWPSDYILEKYAQMCGVPFVEDKLLASALFDAVDEGECIPDSLFTTVSKIYSKLSRYKNSQTEDYFQNRLNKDIVNQIYQLESDIYKSAVKKCSEQSTDEQKEFNGDMESYFMEQLFSIAKSNGLNCRHARNNILNIDEFYLEAFFTEKNLTSWQMAFVRPQERQIHIAARAVCEFFDFSQVDNALNFVKALAKAANGKLKHDKSIYCNEFKITPRLYEIAHSSIKTMLEMNRSQTGIEYEYDDSYKTFAVIYLKPQINKKFEIVITYSEFMRNPSAFKNFIASPRKKTKWNFWCKVKKEDPDTLS